MLNSIKLGVAGALLALLPLLATACGSSVDLEGPQGAAQFRADPDPTSLGQIHERVSNLQVDDQRIYWLANANLDDHGYTLRSCEKLHCASTVVSYAEYFLPYPFGIAQGQIFWIEQDFELNNQRLLSCPVGGCGGAPRQIAALGILPTALTFGPDAAYLCGESQFWKIPLSGTEPIIELPAPATCVGVAVRDQSVYWIGQSDYQSPFALWSMPVDGTGNPRMLVDQLRVVPFDGYNGAHWQVLAVDSANAYWSEGTLYGSLVRCPLSGCADGPEVIAEPVRSPTSVLLDGKTLYFEHDTSASGVAVSSVQLPEGTPSEPLASGVVAQSALAVDDQYLYTATTRDSLPPDGTWSDPWSSIRRIPKEAAQ